MQTELFEKNAVILFYDEVQRMLYHDALSANGYSVKDMHSIHAVSYTHLTLPTMAVV